MTIAEQQLRAELEEVRARLDEAEETLNAIRTGTVDALVVQGPDGHAVYTLAGAERVYRLLVEAMNEGALVVSPQGSIIYSNHTFAAMLGVPLEQVIGSSVYDYVSHSDKTAVRELLQDALWTPGRREIVLLKAGAKEVPANLSVGGLDVEETADSISAVVTDLTEHRALECELESYREHLEELVEQRTLQLEEAVAGLKVEIEARKLAEEALRVSEERFRAVYESTQDAILLSDDTGTYVDANPAAERLFGMPRQLILGRSLSDFLERRIDQGTVWADFIRSNGSGERLRVMRPDGLARDVEGHAVANILPGRHLTVLHDITDRMRYEKALAASRAQAERRTAEMRSFVHSMADGVVLFDANRNILLANENVRNLMGPPQGLPEDSWTHEYELFTLDGKPVAREDYPSYRALRGLDTHNCRYKMVTPWKESIVSISASPARDANGTVFGGSVSFRDIAGMVEFERRREQLYQREHHIAEMLQQALMPARIPERIDGWTIAARYQPALEEALVGGDFYDVFHLGESRLGILIGDVAGKGLGAAIRVAAVRYAIRSYAYVQSNPAEVMSLTNDGLVKEGADEGSVLTAFFGVVDLATGILTYSNAGHEPPMIRNSRGEVTELDVCGPMLGILPGAGYVEKTVQLRLGDSVVMLTDGITEARTKDCVMFEKGGVIAHLSRSADASPDQTAEALLQAATLHAGGNLQDDVAIVVLGHDSAS